MDEKLWKQAKRLQAEMTENRRWLHLHAEVGFAVNKTKKFLKEKLSEIGIVPVELGHGSLVCTIGKGNGDALMLRADIDALPIKERSGESFACKTGNMHACGHDMHAATLLGVARLLKENERALQTPVKLLFQSAEEILQGAEDCVKNGVLKGVRAAIALHVAVGTPFPTGTVIIPEGGAGAPAADYFKIEIKGNGCHGSTPHKGVDALLVGTQIATSLQEIVSREISSDIPSVLTVGRFYAGNAGNAIADRAEMEGTLRTTDETVREFIKKRIAELSRNIAKAFRARAKTDYSGGCPVLVNDPAICRYLSECVGQVLDERFIKQASALGKGATGGSEDFAYIAKEVPSVMFALCAGSSNEGYTESLHSPKVRFDESALVYGAAVLAGAALHFKET